MSGKIRTVFIARSLDEVIYHKNSVSNLQILGGATQVKDLAEEYLTVINVPELKIAEKHETYIDFGPAVTLNKMLEFEKNHLPRVLCEAIKTVGNNAVRNMATLGGNICSKNFKHTLYAPLLALGAQVELKKNQKVTKYFPFEKFENELSDHILTNIRIPLDEWDVEIFRRVGPSNKISKLSASFVFLVNIQKNIITNLHIAFAGPIVFHSLELENKLISTRLPLKTDFIEEILHEAEQQYDTKFSSKNISPVLKIEFLNLLRYSLEQLH